MIYVLLFCHPYCAQALFWASLDTFLRQAFTSVRTFLVDPLLITPIFLKIKIVILILSISKGTPLSRLNTHVYTRISTNYSR